MSDHPTQATLTPTAPQPLPRGFAVGVFLTALLIILSREPSWLLDPRFWAEEGLIHFVNAFHNPVGEALIYVNVTGYLVLVSNIATVLAAKLLPLPLAAYGTLVIAALVHALPALLIASAKAPGWSAPQRISLALVTLLIGPSTESWLNTINSQFVLVVVAGLLLITDHRGAWWRVGLCFLVPLASPVPAFLAPLFVLRGALTRQRRKIIEGGCYALGALCAAAIAVWYSQNHVQTGAVDRLGKDLLPDVIAIAHVLAVKTTGFLLGGDWGSQLVFSWLTGLQGDQPTAYGALALMLAAPPFLFGAWAAWRQPEAFWLFMACGAILVLTMIFAGEGPATQLGPEAGRRYVFPVNVLLMLTLAIGFWPRDRRLSVAGAGLALILLINAVAFWLAPMDQQGPSWRGQAQAWLDDPTQPVRFWPGVPGNPAAWSARLTPPVTVLEPITTGEDGVITTRLMRWREEPVEMSLDVAGRASITIALETGTDGEAGPVTIAAPTWQLADDTSMPLEITGQTFDARPHIGTEHYQRAVSLNAPTTLTIPVPEGAARLTLAVGIDYRRSYRNVTAILRLIPSS